MAKEVTQHRGHRIALEVIKKGRQRYVWTYTIDGGPSHECKDRPLGSEEAAREECVADAKFRAERLGL